MNETLHCGFIAIVGRPNVGKSTLMNALLGQKISITSRKPQTTRHRILGIKTTDEAQFIFVDTPGLHRRAERAINRYMNRAARETLQDVDAIVLVVEGTRWTDEDQMVLELIEPLSVPKILVINKVDKLADKAALLPHLEWLAQQAEFAQLIPVSASKGTQVDALEDALKDLLPQSHPFFPPEQITDRSERFLAAELIREKLMRLLGEEVPYRLTVEIEQFKEHEGKLDIGAVIWVERDGQKAIVIGKQGAMLKRVGTEARHDMERLFGNKVFLQLWVRVKQGWSDDDRALKSLGYGDES